jgi:hypothetical protein
MTMLVEQSNNLDSFFGSAEIHRIGEAIEQAASDSRVDFRELKRASGNTAHYIVYLFQKFSSKNRALVFVPDGSSFDVMPCLKPNDEFPSSPFRLAMTKFQSDFVAYLVPGPSRPRIGFMGSDTLVKYSPMPFGNGNLIPPGCDASPERLNVINLIFNRKIFETRRRKP